MHKTQLILTLLAATGLAALTGCQPKPAAAPADDFFAASEDSTRTTDVMSAQASSGARADGMLYAAHFAGANLNSNGMSKLDRMLADDDPCQPLTVYLSTPAGDTQAAARKSAITAYLKDRGLKSEQIEVVAGENPQSSHPAAPLLQRMERTESAPGAAGSSGGIAPTDSSGSGPTQTSTESAKLVGGA